MASSRAASRRAVSEVRGLATWWMVTGKLRDEMETMGAWKKKREKREASRVAEEMTSLQ
jgi:hypothetical protein